MAKESIETALKRFDERYFKLKIDKEILDDFGKSLSSYLKKIDSAVQDNESEEHIKNIVNAFLEKNFYSDPKFEINTYKRIDSAITYNDVVYAILETKKPSNKIEMVSEDNINRKALWEVVYYYLCETRNVYEEKVKINYESEIRRLIITDSQRWFLIDAQDLEKICEGFIETLFYKFENKQLTYRDVDKFYGALSEHFSQIDITKKLRYVYLKIDKNGLKGNNWQYLYKALSRDFLLKDGYKQIVKTHELNNKFYQELLYLMGLKEEKSNQKKVILIDSSVKNSLANQVFSILTEEKELPTDLAKEETFEIVLIWINRLLFIKLFEGQLISFNGNCPEYHILDNDKIRDFQDLQTLFFEVLGKKERDDIPFLQQFAQVPYLNSSLFERYEVETKYVNIREIKNELVQKKKASILGKKGPDKLPLLEYIIDFLNSFSFTAQNINEDEKISSSEIIDASVLGLIFEKINGYKEGSFYTKSFVTEYICQETIERMVVRKLNKEFVWHCETIDDIKLVIDTTSHEQIKRINEIIDDLKICDPAVGSGHFLVSALNRIISLKKELGILLKHDGKTPFREYNIAVIDDVLCVFDGQGKEFKYNPNDSLSQSIQKTLFIEKKRIIENCLYGVDINPNAVVICQLRLWIELLKNAYYENGVMETLPNIDINIKCGNSLINKIPFQVGKSIAAKNGEFTKDDQAIICDYKDTVKKYQSVSSKKEKQNLKDIINKIKKSLHMVCQQVEMKAKGADLFLEYDTDNALDIYNGAFEWAIEFPEIISEEGVFLGFDGIVGNPPYIRVQELNYEVIDYYKKNYSTAWKRIDISTLFIELSYKLIPQDAVASFITSNQFLTAEYGKQIRHFIWENKYVNKTIDFQDLPVFDEALTYVSIFFFQKNRLNRNIKYYKVPQLPFIIPNEEQYYKVEYQLLSEDIWNFEAMKYKKIFDSMEEHASELITKYAKPSCGIFTGNDKIMMMDLVQNDIEEDIFFPVIRPKGCVRYGKAFPNKKVIYPYKKQGENTVIISSSEMERDYPQAWNYLLGHEQELKKRKDSRKTFGNREDWYGLVRFGQIATFQKCKIMTPGEVKHNKFCLDYTHSGFMGARTFAITMTTNEVDICYVLAILNSKLIEFFLHHIAPRKAGGYYSYSASVLERIPFVIANDQQPIVELVRKIMDLTEKGQETDFLENEIDQMIYELYGIDEEGKNLIEQDLSSY